MSMCFSCAVGACNAERFGIREWWLKIGLRSVGGTQNSSCSSLPPQPPRHPPHPPHPRSPLQPPPPPPWRWEALRACRSAGRAISFFCISLLPFGLGAERLLILNIIQSLQTVCLVPSLGYPSSVIVFTFYTAQAPHYLTNHDIIPAKNIHLAPTGSPRYCRQQRHPSSEEYPAAVSSGDQLVRQKRPTTSKAKETYY